MTCIQPSAAWAARARLLGVSGALLFQFACIKGSLGELASPEASAHIDTILDNVDIQHRLGGIAQEVLNVGRLNMADETWRGLLETTTHALIADATPTLKAAGVEVTPMVRTALVDAVRTALRRLADTPGVQDRDLIAAAVTEAIARTVSEPLSDDQRATLAANLAMYPSTDRDAVLAGPDPFARTLARNMALGFFDGLGASDMEPYHRFLAEERSALAEAAQDSFLAWRISLLAGAGGITMGLLVLALVVGRDLRLRRANRKALRLIAGVLKSRESDPDMRTLLVAMAQLEDPAAARQLREFYAAHPELRPNPPDASATHTV